MRNRREIEDKVAELLKRHGIKDAPVPVEKIANAEGIPVIEMSFPSDVSGALIKRGDIVAISVNGTQSSTRKRFTIAHELAHHVLNHVDGDHIDWHFTVIRRDRKSSDASDTQEIEANSFAANLLMPKSFVLRDIERFTNFQGEPEITDFARQFLARKYNVSEIAMGIRLTNLGLTSPY
jgi:Zn-dependent peptidase ImmA (M78 family)